MKPTVGSDDGTTVAAGPGGRARWMAIWGTPIATATAVTAATVQPVFRRRCRRLPAVTTSSMSKRGGGGSALASRNSSESSGRTVLLRPLVQDGAERVETPGRVRLDGSLRAVQRGGGLLH